MKQEEELIMRWNADLYDQVETDTEDVEFMLNMIGTEPKKILEVCCGSGRILVPLAKAGHHVTGFDQDDYMLAKIEDKSEGLTNLIWYKNDAIKDDWGYNFDVVILAGNIMINIETDMDYKEAQELFIQKAYDSLLPGGYIYLDFNLFRKPENIFGSSTERVIFEGRDSVGNYGMIKILGGSYHTQTQISSSNVYHEIKTNNGDIIKKNYTKDKHIPTLDNIKNWLVDTGFTVEKLYGNYRGEEISETTNRVIIWARKGEKVWRL